MARLLPEIRQRLGLSATAFAERAREVGLKFDRGIISKIENGQRGVSLDEGLAIAAALDVAPVHLFLPREDQDNVLVAPGVEVLAELARAWLRGDDPLPGRDDKVFRTEVPGSEWSQRNRELTAAREAWERHRRRYLVAKEKLGLLSDRLGELDEAIANETTMERALRGYGAGGVMGGRRNPAAEERDRLSRLYDAALQEVAEAKVDLDDARADYHRIKAEVGGPSQAEINAALRQRGHKLPGDGDGDS